MTNMTPTLLHPLRNEALGCESDGETHSSVPADETVTVPSNASIFAYESTRPRNDFPKKSRGDEPESRSRDDWDKLQRDLKEERGRRKQYEDELIEKDTRLAEIQSKAESELKEKDKELDEVRKGWRKLAGELNKIRAKGQGFYQVTDAYLTDKTKSLRFSIRNFAIQYFDGELKHNVTINPDFVNRYVKPVIPLQPTAYRNLFTSPTSCSLLIEGILWQVLTSCVFNHFIWAGKVAEDVCSLHQTLSPTSRDTPPNAEAERKFHAWSATTTSLLLEELDLKEGGDAYEKVEKRKLFLLDDISGMIRPLAKSDSGFKQELLKIIGDAIALDLELSRQVARVIWVYDREVFGDCTMALKERESSQTGKNDVYLLAAPGLTKRGKSTGEDFKTETSLLPMAVKRASVPVQSEQNTFRRNIG